MFSLQEISSMYPGLLIVLYPMYGVDSQTDPYRPLDAKDNCQELTSAFNVAVQIEA